MEFVLDTALVFYAFIHCDAENLPLVLDVAKAQSRNKQEYKEDVRRPIHVETNRTNVIYT